MTSREFTESLAFEHLEPDPAAVTMRLVGQLVTLMANVYRDTKAKPQPYTLDDFLPDPAAPPKAEREAHVTAWLVAAQLRHRERQAH